MFYIIIYGQKKFSKKLGEKNEWCLCCGHTKVSYIRTLTFFTLFMIPLFPVMVRYFKVCPKCERGVKVARKQFFYELRSSFELPPSPFDGGESAAGTAREIVIKRDKQFFGSRESIKCFVDGREVASIKKGLSARFCVKSDAKSLFLATKEFNNKKHSQVVDLQKDDRCFYRIKTEKNTIDMKGWNPYLHRFNETEPNV